MYVWKQHWSSVLTVVWPQLQLLVASRYSSLPGSDTAGGRQLWPCRSRPCLQITDTIFLFSVLLQQQQQQHWLHASHGVCSRGGHWWSGHQEEEKHQLGCDKLDADTCSLWNDLQCFFINFHGIFWHEQSLPEMSCPKASASGNIMCLPTKHLKTGRQGMPSMCTLQPISWQAYEEPFNSDEGWWHGFLITSFCFSHKNTNTKGTTRSEQQESEDSDVLSLLHDISAFTLISGRSPFNEF